MNMVNANDLTWNNTGYFTNSANGFFMKTSANNIPFYVALPSSTIDFSMIDGVKEIPIEQRERQEVSCMEGLLEDGRFGKVKIIPDDSPVANFGFDVTPAKYVTGLITERGICRATREGILGLFPEGENRN